MEATTLSKLVDYLELRDPLRNELLEAYFGAGSFVSGNAVMSPHDIGSLYFLRACHALCWFDSKPCWINFITSACLLLRESLSRGINKEDEVLTPWFVVNGKWFIYQQGDQPHAICLTTNTEVSGDTVEPPCFMVTLSTTILMQRGVDEFAKHCERPQPTS